MNLELDELSQICHNYLGGGEFLPLYMTLPHDTYSYELVSSMMDIESDSNTC